MCWVLNEPIAARLAMVVAPYRCQVVNLTNKQKALLKKLQESFHSEGNQAPKKPLWFEGMKINY
jgi:hypothetical protein